MASFNLLHQIPSGFCSLLQVRAFNLLHQIPSGFCSLLQVRALFIFKILSGITKFKYERKNEINSFISKNKSSRNSQLDPMAPVALRSILFGRYPYVSQLFCFRARFRILFVHIVFPTKSWGLPRTARLLLIWRKVAPSRRVTRLPEIPLASQHLLHFLTETWRSITLKNK